MVHGMPGCVGLAVGLDEYVVRRSLYDLSVLEWSFNGATQAPDENVYAAAIVDSMNVGGLAEVLIILNQIVFMFENRGLLMWNPHAQRNVLRSLFMSPSDASSFAEKAQAVAAANSAYRNLLYIVNRDRKQLDRHEAALASADALTAEYHSLQQALNAGVEVIQSLIDKRVAADEARTDARTAVETARFNYDDLLREIEALKLARVASAFPNATNAGKYMLARMIGDKECLACGSKGGPLIDQWVTAVETGACLVCGTEPEKQEKLVPETTVDAARIARAEQRLAGAQKAMETATSEFANRIADFDTVQKELDQQNVLRASREKRIRELTGSLPPSLPEVQAFRDRIKRQSETLETLSKEQREAEVEFSLLFDGFRRSVEARASAIR